MTKYVLLIAATVVLVFAGLAYFFYTREQSAREDVATAKAETAKVRTERDAAIKANEISQKTITALRDSFKVANELAAENAAEVEKISNEADALRDELNALKDTDDEVRTYLGAPVPGALQKLYSGVDRGGSN